MKKEEFVELYENNTLRELEQLLHCSAPTIYKRINEYGIPKKGQGKGKRNKRKLDLE